MPPVLKDKLALIPSGGGTTFKETIPEKLLMPLIETGKYSSFAVRITDEAG
jgi:hypothetical protein